MDGREIELKLGVAPGDVARLSSSFPLAADAGAAPSPLRLASVYFDTPDFHLAAAGVSLRIRRLGDGRLVQTVKAPQRGAGGLFVRAEWQTPLENAYPDPLCLRATGLAVFADEAVIAALRPMFSTEIDRIVYRLGDPEAGWEVEAALDLGHVIAGPRSVPISEVEFELVRGHPDRLFLLARQILETVPARPLSISKSERGVRLATGDSDRPVKARPPLIGPDQTVAEAFQAIARSCLDHLLANEHCLLATGDGEAIHQMRVALRRLRSAIRLFRPLVETPRLAEVKAELSWLLSRLGPARDAQVFLTEIIDPVVSAHPDDARLGALRDHWRSDLQATLDRAVAAVRDRRFAALVLDLGAWVEAGDWLGEPGRPPRRKLDGPITPFAFARMGKTVRRLIRQGGNELSRLSPEERHEVRILCKQARYAGEFFSALVPRKQMKLYLAELSEVQDILGRLNDIAVAGPKLLAGREETGGHAHAAATVERWHHGRRADLLAEADRAWRRLTARPLPWAEE